MGPAAFRMGWCIKRMVSGPADDPGPLFPAASMEFSRKSMASLVSTPSSPFSKALSRETKSQPLTDAEA